MITWKYIAGFFDGEGSLTNNGKGFRITIPQTNKKVLDAIKKFTEIGYIFKNKKRRAHWKDSWVYYISRQEDIQTFVKNICQYTIVKKNQIDKTLPKIIKKVNEINQKKLELDIKIKTAKKLRTDGATFRQIGKILNIDWGNARRLTLK